MARARFKSLQNFVLRGRLYDEEGNYVDAKDVIAAASGGANPGNPKADAWFSGVTTLVGTQAVPAPNGGRFRLTARSGTRNTFTIGNPSNAGRIIRVTLQGALGSGISYRVTTGDRRVIRAALFSAGSGRTIALNRQYIDFLGSSTASARADEGDYLEFYDEGNAWFVEGRSAGTAPWGHG